ncbi:hypothetical protein [Streptomyces sp. NBC_00076]|uniref:hypothetical protein n=1 Tax=Streptomyces sp. NBC_00076 TaxID=2975642 RepID=UPI003250C0E3
MGTAERHEAPSEGGADADDVAAHLTARQALDAPDHDIPKAGPGPRDGRGARTASEGGPATRESAARTNGDAASRPSGVAEEQPYYRPLWVEEPARRRRLPDPVRTSAVRAVLIIAVTLVQAMVAFLCTMAGSWLAFPMVLSGVASTVLATWGALDVWVTRQVWNQRNGVVSTPSSTARALRRERRKARRQARATERTQERIRRREGTGQVAHP